MLSTGLPVPALRPRRGRSARPDGCAARPGAQARSARPKAGNPIRSPRASTRTPPPPLRARAIAQAAPGFAAPGDRSPDPRSPRDGSASPARSGAGRGLQQPDSEIWPHLVIGAPLPGRVRRDADLNVGEGIELETWLPTAWRTCGRSWPSRTAASRPAPRPGPALRSRASRCRGSRSRRPSGWLRCCARGGCCAAPGPRSARPPEAVDMIEVAALAIGADKITLSDALRRWCGDAGRGGGRDQRSSARIRSSRSTPICRNRSSMSSGTQFSRISPS